MSVPLRSDAVDAARAVAFVAVVFGHSVPASSPLAPLCAGGTFAVPFYICLSLYFQARTFRRNPGRPLGPYIWGRVRRLYLPFLAWSVVYLLFWNVKNLALGRGAWTWPSASDLWIGTAIHLWFVPFLLVCLILTSTLARACARWSAVRWSVVATAAAAGTVLALVPRPDWLNHVDREGYWWLQCWRALPSALLGLAMAWGLPGARPLRGPARSKLLWWAGCAGVAVTVGMIAYQASAGYWRAARTLGGLGWAAVAVAGWRAVWVAWLARFGRYGYGAYLSHLLVISVFHGLARAAGIGQSPALELVMTAAGVVGGLGIARWIAGRPRLAWLNG